MVIQKMPQQYRPDDNRVTAWRGIVVYGAHSAAVNGPLCSHNVDLGHTMLSKDGKVTAGVYVSPIKDTAWSYSVAQKVFDILGIPEQEQRWLKMCLELKVDENLRIRAVKREGQNIQHVYPEVAREVVALHVAPNHPPRAAEGRITSWDPRLEASPTLHPRIIKTGDHWHEDQSEIEEFTTQPKAMPKRAAGFLPPPVPPPADKTVIICPRCAHRMFESVVKTKCLKCGLALKQAAAPLQPNPPTRACSVGGAGNPWIISGRQGPALQNPSSGSRVLAQAPPPPTGPAPPRSRSPRSNSRR